MRLFSSFLPVVVRPQALYGAGTQTLNPLDSDINTDSKQRLFKL